METIKTHVNIPDDRRLVLDLHLPQTISPGSTDVVLIFQTLKEKRLQHKRILGSFKGRVKVGDDFDEPLGDGFWLGKGDKIPA